METERHRLLRSTWTGWRAKEGGDQKGELMVSKPAHPQRRWFGNKEQWLRLPKP
jgi:hypothetical protein